MSGDGSGDAPRVLCVSGDSGSGKTALLRRLLPRLGLPPRQVGVVKDTHHAIDWHPAGKDSALLWEAGPGALCVAGPNQAALFVRTGEGAPSAPGTEGATRRLIRACRRMPPGVRLVLAEGFRDARAPTIWTAGGGPGEESLSPDVRAAVVPASEAAAWREAHPDLDVRSREEAAPLAGRVPGWAAAPPELAGG